jgi:tetratricopeptide (TPR) repeat protein
LEYLQKGLLLAQETGHADLAAAIWHNLGNLFTSQTEYPEALHAYTEGLELAEQTGNRALAARTLTNAAVAAMRHGRPQEANTRLDQAMQQLGGLEPSHDRAYGLISLGLAYNDLRVHLPEAHDRLLLQAAKALDEAAKTAEAKGDARAASYAWGHLGALYEEEQRYQEALRLTRHAAFAAQQVQVPESLYRWQWQTGRLFKALGQSDAAIAAYRRAVATLQSFRLERIPSVSWRRTSFRQDVGPVYFELVDLLLQKAASLPERVQYELYLKETRDTVELFKEAELRDFFQDECVEAARRETDLERVSKTAIVVYPILLPDRLELLVSLPDGLKRIPVPIDAATLTPVVREFRRMLEKRTTREYLPLAQQLYTWLIRPLEADLAATAIDTLVFVPDGALRTIPMAALHDGEQFLIR